MKKIILGFLISAVLLFISCKEKKSEEIKASESISVTNEIESAPDESESMYKTFPVGFPSRWVSSDGKTRFALEDGLKYTKKYYNDRLRSESVIILVEMMGKATVASSLSHLKLKKLISWKLIVLQKNSRQL